MASEMQFSAPFRRDWMCSWNEPAEQLLLLSSLVGGSDEGELYFCLMTFWKQPGLRVRNYMNTGSF